MKKTIVIISIIFAIAIITLISAVVLLNKNNFNNGTNNLLAYREELKNEEKHIIAEKSYSNAAWGISYYGTAIFNDGTIYKFDINDFKSGDGVPMEQLIAKYGNKQSIKVTDGDLKQIENNIITLEDKIESKNTAMDAGSNYIAVYKNGKKITLQEKGDYTGDNKTKEAKTIKKIITKYLGNFEFQFQF